MFILKHLKTLQNVSIIIQIIFREIVCSLLKSLILKFVKNVKSQHWLFTFLTSFKISDFNKEHTISLKMIWMMIETFWSGFKCFNMNILD